MVLLILAVLWIVVLAPTLIRRLTAQRSGESIDSFYYQLHMLERTGPKLVRPAHRLATARSTSTGFATGQPGLPTGSSMSGRPNLVLLEPAGDGEPGVEGEVVDEASGERYRRLCHQEEAGPTSIGVPISLVSPRVEDYRRRQVQRRRREILLWLVATCGLTGLLGIVPSLHALWVLTVVSGMGLAAYVGLATYAQALETDRHSSRAGRGRLRDDDRYSPAAAGVAAAGGPRGWQPGPRVAAEPSPSWAATVGYPGAWDEDGYRDGTGRYYEDEYDEYEPRRAAAGR